MTSCPEFKARIDRYQGLDASSRAALDEHLVTCAGCAEYKTEADETAQLLRTLRQRLIPTAPIDQAFERLDGRLAALRRQKIWGLVLIATCVTAPFAMLLRGEPPWAAIGLLAIAVAGAAATMWQMQREQGAMLGLTQRPGDFHARWQRDLEKKIRMLTGAGVLVAAWSVGFMFYSVLGPFGIVERIVVLCAAFILAVGALHTFVIERKQLKDELELVRDASRG